jgi:lipid-binding SYLF domain-containing protein
MKNMLTLGGVLLAALIVGQPSTSFARDLQKDVNQATSIIERFREMPEKGIPEAVLRDAKGLAILTTLKAGFVFSGHGGSGVVVARTPHGWSGPSAIGTGGAGFGFLIGGEVSEIVLVLNTPEAVDAFAHHANVKLGGDLSVAAGPVGRNLAAAVMPVAAVYTYSRSQGLYGGISLEGAVIATRNDANEAYYGRSVTPAHILSGAVRPPRGSEKLLLALGRTQRDRPRS